MSSDAIVGDRYHHKPVTHCVKHQKKSVGYFPLHRQKNHGSM
ncbi:hypothetical protein [Okeania hirsuta]|nr:hypothetical protein [Okeania hirsuta]